MSNNVIAATTGTATYTFTVGVERPVKVSAAGFTSGVETITIKEVLADGVEVAVVLKDGTALGLTKDWTAVIIDGPGKYKIDKPATVQSVGVYLT